MAAFDPEPRDDERPGYTQDVSECGVCDRTEPVAVVEAVGQGWHYTRAHGLCCPDCTEEEAA